MGLENMAVKGPPAALRSWQFSVASCVSFLALEVAYFLFSWNPKDPSVDPVIAIILSVECWFMLQISTANLKQKHADGSTSKGGMLYTRMTGLALLPLMAATFPAFHIPYPKWIAVSAALLTCVGRIMWLKQDTAKSYLV